MTHTPWRVIVGHTEEWWYPIFHTLPSFLHTYEKRDLTFLPTVSPKHIKDLDVTEDYFKVFVAKNPFDSVTDEVVLRSDNDNTYLHSDMYTFELGPSDNRIEL